MLLGGKRRNIKQYQVSPDSEYIQELKDVQDDFEIDTRERRLVDYLIDNNLAFDNPRPLKDRIKSEVKRIPREAYYDIVEQKTNIPKKQLRKNQKIKDNFKNINDDLLFDFGVNNIAYRRDGKNKIPLKKQPLPNIPIEMIDLEEKSMPKVERLAPIRPQFQPLIERRFVKQKPIRPIGMFEFEMPKPDIPLTSRNRTQVDIPFIQPLRFVAYYPENPIGRFVKGNIIESDDAYDRRIRAYNQMIRDRMKNNKETREQATNYANNRTKQLYENFLRSN